MSEPQSVVVMSYAPAVRKRRWWPVILIGFLLAAAGGSACFYRDYLLAEYQRRQAFYALFKTTLPSRRYVMNDPSDADGNISKMRTNWLSRNGLFVASGALFREMTLCNSAGRIGVQASDGVRYPVFIGELRSPAGNRRLLLINFGREGYDDGDNGPNALPHFICQLYTFSSGLRSTITPANIQPSSDTATRAASTIRGNWQVTLFAWMGRRTKLETTATTRSATRNDEVRVPIWLDGQPDELVFNLHDDDSITVTPGSGGALPLKVNLQPSRDHPATRPS